MIKKYSTFSNEREIQWKMWGLQHAQILELTQHCLNMLHPFWGDRGMSPIFSHAHSLLFKIGGFDNCANSCSRFKTPQELKATSAQRILSSGKVWTVTYVRFAVKTIFHSQRFAVFWNGEIWKSIHTQKTKQTNKSVDYDCWVDLGIPINRRVTEPTLLQTFYGNFFRLFRWCDE